MEFSDGMKFNFDKIELRLHTSWAAWVFDFHSNELTPELAERDFLTKTD